jgi:hypothetical protein
MKIPGFTADASISVVKSGRGAQGVETARSTAAPIVPQARFGGFGPTLPSCHWEKQWVVCGSALPGYSPPMCLEWVYVCKFPGSSRATRFLN